MRQHAAALITQCICEIKLEFHSNMCAAADATADHLALSTLIR